VVGRKADGVFDPAALAAAPPPQGPVAKEKRSSRQALLAAARSYFDGIHLYDSSVVQFHPGCIENGVTLTAVRSLAPGGPAVGDRANNLGVF
jgi:hypothetical protein